MKILWVTNVPLPEASFLINEEPVPYGGWLINTAAQLSLQSGISLEVAFPKKNIKTMIELKGEKINYFIFPTLDLLDKEMIVENPFLMEIITQSNPDMVHIFGTEYVHSLATVNICSKKNIKSVISIQGLVSVISRHYTVGLPKDRIKKSSFRDFIRKDNIFNQQKKFAERGRYEIEAIKNVPHIIGRTVWDRACISFINQDVQYHHCNETLRNSFYDHKWEIDNCEKYSIFISQGSYPIKGLHFMIEALALVIGDFPEAKLYIGGTDIIKSFTLSDRLRISSYGKYIKELISKHKLENHVIFTGLLDERHMCQRYLKSHVFVCPSTIENSPNSLGEAMMLGLPIVASNVGGISDLLTHKEEGFLYQSDAPYMLAFYICEIFRNEEIALDFSEKARIKAMMTHDKEKNHKRLLEIYQCIIEEDKVQEKGEFYESIG